MHRPSNYISALKLGSICQAKQAVLKLKVKKLMEEERFYVANRYNETIVDHLENTPKSLTS